MVGLTVGDGVKPASHAHFVSTQEELITHSSPPQFASGYFPAITNTYLEVYLNVTVINCRETLMFSLTLVSLARFQYST